MDTGRVRCSLHAGRISGDPRRASGVALRLSADALACIVAQSAASVGVLRARSAGTMALVLADGRELVFEKHGSRSVVDYAVNSNGQQTFVATCAAGLESPIDGAPLVGAGRTHVIGQFSESPRRQIVALDSDAGISHSSKKRQGIAERAGATSNGTPAARRSAVTPRRAPYTSTRTQPRPLPSRLQSFCTPSRSKTVAARTKAIAPSESGMSMSPLYCPFDGLAEPSHRPTKPPLADKDAPLALSSTDRDRAALVEQLAQRFREYDAHDRWVSERLAVFRTLKDKLRSADSDEARRSAVFRVTVEEKRISSDPEYAQRIEQLEASYAAVVLLQRRLSTH